jgi:DNA transformation protein
VSVSEAYRTFVLDSLGRVVPAVRGRPMFGGVGIYAGDLFFALIDDDVLYLKVDDSNRGDFEARGLGPFRPFGEGGEVMQYYELPNDIVEDDSELRAWALKSIDVARRKRRPKSAQPPGPAGRKKEPGTRSRPKPPPRRK